MMPDATLQALAREVGLLARWRDAAGRPQQVSADNLRAILSAMGLPCGSPRAARDSLVRYRIEAQAAAERFQTAEAGRATVLRRAAKVTSAQLHFEDGTRRDLKLRAVADGVELPPVAEPGYHVLEIDGRRLDLAVAPRRAVQVEDLSPGRRLWGVAAQVYALRGSSPAGFGDFTALGEFAEVAGRAGSDALAISPVHALFAADASRFSPYSPSTRLFLNGLYADPAALFGDLTTETEPDGGDLVDWETAAPIRMRRLHAVFEQARTRPDDPRWRTFEAFRTAGGEDLENHARFEALHGCFWHASGAPGWSRWPAEFQDVGGAAAARFARDHNAEVQFHAFVQWLAEAGLEQAQARAKAAGMTVGLIADLAVGMDPEGSHAWSRPADLLRGLSVGAPADLFQPKGQDWGIATFSPLALRRSGYAGFLATLRTAMRHAGGVRIDHAMGLRRLWLTPSGATAAQGAYVQYPFEDLIRLIALESHRRHAVVVGEDLGTVPEGFRETAEAAGLMGMRVLWFERKDDRFVPPGRWSAQAAALSTTHDLPTVAGWWLGRDLDWALRLGMGEADARRRAERVAEREALWSTAVAAGAVDGPAPPPETPNPAVDAALALVAATPCPLAIFPTEDILADPEQPNLPGTIDTHPNWRRRMPARAEAVFQDPAVQARVATIKSGRSRPASE